MKNLMMSLLVLVSSVQAFAASQNLYAPTLKDVTVLHDSFEKEFSPFLFHWIMGEAMDMKMHQTCIKVRVNQGALSCISSSGKSTLVGQLGNRIGNAQEWQVLQVKWNNNVKILETTVNDRFVYQLMVIDPLLR